MYSFQKATLRVDFIENFFVLNGKTPPKLMNVYMWRTLCRELIEKDIS